MKNNKGFTLIEMLVVIAIIGLLSSVVLVALGPSRNKAKDARIISDLNQIRTIMETLYDPSTGNYPGGASAVGNNDIIRAKEDIDSSGGTHFGITPLAANSYYYAVAILNDGKTYYCVDSSGNSLSIGTSAPGSGATACKQ
jgi:prepilin-type N-terminal cleavage/methylation domain-containing protein